MCAKPYAHKILDTILVANEEEITVTEAISRGPKGPDSVLKCKAYLSIAQ